LGLGDLAGVIQASMTACHGVRLSCKFGTASGRSIGISYVRKEAIAPTRDGLNKPGALRRIAKCLPDFVDGLVEPVIEVYEGIRGPEPLLQILAHYDLAGVLDQHGQDLKRLLLNSDLQSMLSEFAGAEIKLEDAKAKTPRKMMIF
jgi:hypothetical protein